MPDPLTSFSLACGVAQIVSLSADIFKLAKTVADHGSPDPTLAEKAASLSTLSNNLRGALVLRNQQPGQMATKAQVELEQLSAQCLDAARAVTDEFSKIRWKPVTAASGSTSGRRIRGPVPQALKMLLRKSKIEKLEKEMGRAEQALQLGLLSELWFSKEDAKKVSVAPQFRELNPELQRFINEWSGHHAGLVNLITETATDLGETAKDEHSKTRLAMVEQLKSQESSLDAKAQYDQLMQSLDFGSMNQRKNNLRCAHEQTFRWVFLDTNRGGKQWSSFTEWLESDQKIYWVFGKPGSGKSTLMKFLVEDPDSVQQIQRGNKRTMILSFFLWSGGFAEQRTIHGLLCSILHQVLAEAPEIAHRLLSGQDAEEFVQRKRRITDWSVKSLKKILFSVLQAVNWPTYIFLDGLDEVDRPNGPYELIELIQEFQATSAAKLCISSRPEPALQQAFKEHPKLRLQDLTQPDIKSVVSDFLGKLHLRNRQLLVDEKRKASIVQLVVERSGGVFLWVYLVLKSIQRGAVNIDSDGEILRRIQGLPSDLETLYSQTWQRHGEDEKLYRSEAGRYFKFVLATTQRPARSSGQGTTDSRFNQHGISLLELTVACDRELQSAILDSKSMPPLKEILAKIDRCQERIDVCCNGLLEIQRAHQNVSYTDEYVVSPDNLFARFLMPLSAYLPKPSRFDEIDFRALPSGSDLSRLWVAGYHTSIGFLHRSAADFLEESEFGRSIMRHCSDDENRIMTSRLRADLSRILFFSTTVTLELDVQTQVPFRFSEKVPAEIISEYRPLYGKLAGRLFHRGPALEHTIESLKAEILAGDFEGTWLRLLIDFVKSTPSWCLPQFDHLCKIDIAEKIRFGRARSTNCVTAVAMRHFAKVFRHYGLFKGVRGKATSPMNTPSTPRWPFTIPAEVCSQPQDSHAEQLVRLVVYTSQATWLFTDGKRSVHDWVSEYVCNLPETAPTITLENSKIVEPSLTLFDFFLWPNDLENSHDTTNLHLVYHYLLAFNPSALAPSSSCYRIWRRLCASRDPNLGLLGLVHGDPTPFEVYLLQTINWISSTHFTPDVRILLKDLLTLPDIIQWNVAAGVDLERTVTVFVQLNDEEEQLPVLIWKPWYSVDSETLKTHSGVIIRCSVAQLIDYIKRVLEEKNLEHKPANQPDLQGLYLDKHQNTATVLLVSRCSLNLPRFDTELQCVQPSAAQISDILRTLDGTLNNARVFQSLTEVVERIMNSSMPVRIKLEETLRSASLSLPSYQDSGNLWSRTSVILFKGNFFKEGTEEENGIEDENGIELEEVVFRNLFPDALVRTTIKEDNKEFERMLRNCFGELNIILRSPWRRPMWGLR
ncbi:hypothetical protein QBC43DRAFT_324725 [Cladorrhinum sp. PSN259]|nr:hypothetical protein QBC43DRAFT_324725 [Cladorrhinum sp. PSN259]